MFLPSGTYRFDADALDDAIEAEREALRAECEREFDDWRGLDWRNREDADFSEFLVARAQPHMRDHQKYAAAMDWRERSRVDFASLAKGQRQFARGASR